MHQSHPRSGGSESGTAKRLFSESVVENTVADFVKEAERHTEELLAILRIGHETSIRGAGVSIAEALSRTRYRELCPQFGDSDLLAHLRSHPALIEQWLVYSEDKRTDGGRLILSSNSLTSFALWPSSDT
jgi:hypothetical protein